MATKRAAKKKATKKSSRKAAPQPVTPCVKKCLASFQTCIRRGGVRAKCFAALISCLDDCL